MGKNIWDNIWIKDSYAEEDLRKIKAKIKTDYIEDNVNIRKTDNLLDIGCGGGYVSKELKERFGCNVTGIDASRVAIKTAKLVNKSIDFMQMPATSLEFEGDQFDVAICLGVLEHIEEIDSFLSELTRVVKKNGKIVITTSNKYSLMYFHRKMKEMLKCWKYGYQKNWAIDDISTILNMYNIKITNVNYLSGIGDFEYITKIDKIISIFNKKWARYIAIVGEVSK